MLARYLKKLACVALSFKVEEETVKTSQDARESHSRTYREKKARHIARRTREQHEKMITIQQAVIQASMRVVDSSPADKAGKLSHADLVITIAVSHPKDKKKKMLYSTEKETNMQQQET